jgi:hypothetical protein
VKIGDGMNLKIVAIALVALVLVSSCAHTIFTESEENIEPENTSPRNQDDIVCESCGASPLGGGSEGGGDVPC